MKGNVYERFYKGELPEELQKDAERFASCGDSAGEVIFRAGFLIGRRFEEFRKQLIEEDDESMA